MDRTEAVEVLTKMLDCEDIDFCDSDCFKCRLFTRAVDRSNALIMAIKALGKDIDVPTKWNPVTEELPKEKGEYLVTYHPCYWDNVRDVKCVGIDTFRGKASWAKNKYQRVIAWMKKPDPWEGE